LAVGQGRRRITADWSADRAQKRGIKSNRIGNLISDEKKTWQVNVDKWKQERREREVLTGSPTLYAVLQTGGERQKGSVIEQAKISLQG
jgi:hypothetical protein